MAYSQKKIAGDETIHYVSARKEREGRKKRGSTSIQPPLTPMIDIVFQLLLFFLLACQFRANEGQIAANLPDISGKPPEKILIDPIEITLQATGRDNLGVKIYDGNAIVSEQDPDEMEKMTDAQILAVKLQLYEHLMRKKQGHGEDADEVPVTIKPLRNVRWAHVVNTFNQAIRADYKKVGFKPSG